MRTFGFRGPVLQHFSISLDDKRPSMGRKKVVVLGTGQLASVLAGVAQLNFGNIHFFVIFLSVLLGNAQLKYLSPLLSTSTIVLRYSLITGQNMMCQITNTIALLLSC